MKNRFAIALLIAAGALASCTKPESHDPVVPPEPVDPVDTTVHFVPACGVITGADTLKQMWKDTYADPNTVASLDSIFYAQYYSDGKAVGMFDKSARTSLGQYHKAFYTKHHVRFVSEAQGMAISLPSDRRYELDFTLAKYGLRIKMKGADLRLSMEKVNPYTPTEYYYNIYTTEWFDRYINNKIYVTQNGLAYIKSVKKNDETIIAGYSVSTYCIKASGLEKPYHYIALIRKTGQWQNFALLRYNSETQDTAFFEDIIKSYRYFPPYGAVKNYFPAAQPVPNPKWNAETAAYYKKLQDQKTFDFGVFSATIPEDRDYEGDALERIRSEKKRLEGIFNHGYEIMPTYAHISWYNGPRFLFPLKGAAEFAGGDGFNGKPVIQYSYQFTENNNYVTADNTTQCKTPVFDILRGKYDDYFKTLAASIKAYGRPVLFRLNNEMNSDWTSYCGMMTLCDPDIFIATWRYLFDLFDAEGVDNTIWVFNPVTKSCPYSYWGEDLAYYPGDKYVHMLGATNYVMGNDLPFPSFADCYKELYNKSNKDFGNLPWILGEFACGCGGNTTGELKRNAHQQAEWVTGMFDCFVNYDANPWLRPYKAGIWFSCNDYGADNSIVNQLSLDPDLTETLQAFHDGFAKMYPNEK